MNGTGPEHADIAVIGGGPAGMQAALVASRAGKKVVVLDDPAPSRNAASHGVRNFLGLDGLLPGEIREVAWQQIAVYQSAVLHRARVMDLCREADGQFLITAADETRLLATKVVLAVGYHDVYPAVPGFAECWADTIIPCPFCDGYENRGRIWGIVPGSQEQLKRSPKMARNWTSDIKVLLPSDIKIEPTYRQELSSLGIECYEGAVAEVYHSKGKVEAVRLDSGERVEVGTLVWIPPAKPSPLIARLAENLGLALDDSGWVMTDESQQTNVDSLWAAGEVETSCSSGILSAAAGSRAAFGIIRSWYS